MLTRAELQVTSVSDGQQVLGDEFGMLATQLQHFAFDKARETLRRHL